MRKNRFLFALLFLLLSGMAVQAADISRFDDFGHIPVAHEGRIKPLSRYAALLYKNVTGFYPSGEQQGNAWLAETIFDPAGAADTAQFYIPNKQVVYALGLSAGGDMFSFNDINAAFLKNEKLLAALQKTVDPTQDEKDVLKLYETAAAFEQTKDALIEVLPLRTLRDQALPQTFLELPQHGALYKTLLAKGVNNSLFRVIPKDGTWIAPWESVLGKAQNENEKKLISLWQQAATAYIKLDAAAWNRSTHELSQQTTAQSPDKSLSLRLAVEALYQSLDPAFYSFIFYLSGFFFSFGARRKTVLVTYGLLGTGLLLHGLGLGARMIILQRPPVSTLFESVLFVGFLTTLLFFSFAYRQKRDSFLSLTGICGVLFYLIALALNDSQDDLKVLEAVLNTRFWLATHVMAITTGYALSVLTALMAHAALLTRAFKRRSFFATQEFSARIYQLSVWALLFVAGGTLLGGVWADQSWGRFWGWDPKENGALLIVLWLTWLLHAKLSKRFHVHLFNLGLALLGIVVGISWIGVNLLGVGLHSYGFTSGLATGFTLFCGIDILLLGLLWLKGRRNGAFVPTV